jgi:hypothetical protein
MGLARGISAKVMHGVWYRRSKKSMKMGDTKQVRHPDARSDRCIWRCVVAAMHWSTPRPTSKPAPPPHLQRLYVCRRARRRLCQVLQVSDQPALPQLLRARGHTVGQDELVTGCTSAHTM